MNKSEWMPVNPCPCGAVRYPDNHKCNAEDGECSPLAYYEGAVDYQRKLLKFLMNRLSEESNRPLALTINDIKSMLEQLDVLVMDIDKSMTESENEQLIDRGSFAKYVGE